MNRFLVASVGVGLWLCVCSASAMDYVVGVIDPTRIVEQSPQYEAARAQLQQEVSDREEKLAEQQKQIAELQKKLESDAALMSQDELQRLQTDRKSVV